ncbi:MAG: N-acetylneuraminate synthase [Gammaproteobacteria bacterium]|nr:N-acetylneuraminate synthase [Gammaproteobacteria bacterium]NKB65346.1 N-acetylneuraminate synthase [Gammaproteobacteria bacterium]
MITRSVFIIAEAGVNHCGDLGNAREMVEVAAGSGADAIKFQTFRAQSLTVNDAPKAEYQKQNTSDDDSQQEMLARLELSDDDHRQLFDHCQRHGIEFMSTGFDIESVDLLVRLGIQRIKVPSGEITNLPLLRHIAGQGLPVILSTGMSNLAEIDAAISGMISAGLDADHLTVLHCNTAYPTPFEDANLACIGTIKNELKVKVGYSDHTLGDEASVAAVALGATIVEKHFTLDRDLPGPDQFCSLEPGELKQMVTKIRHIEMAMGDGIKQASVSETMNVDIARKSLVAKMAITKGETLSAANITAKRPGTGVSPMRWDELVGTVAKRNYQPDDLLEI